MVHLLFNILSLVRISEVKLSQLVCQKIAKYNGIPLECYVATFRSCSLNMTEQQVCCRLQHRSTAHMTQHRYWIATRLQSRLRR